MARYLFQAPQSLHKERFDKVVHALLNEKVAGGVSKGMARKLVMVGACYLAGSRCRIASKPVYAGTEVRVEYDAARSSVPPKPTVELTTADILYQQDGLIVVNKPAHLPTVATLDNARDNLVNAVKRLLDISYLGIHHRLDAETSGCVLLTTSEDANPFAARLFQENLIQKEYVAICAAQRPVPEGTWEVKNQLVRAEKKRNRYASTEELKKQFPEKVIPEEGSYAFSRFERLQIKGDTVLLRATPITGRTHQLRVHLSEYGLPILGDRLYGGPTAERLMLHAWKLSFRGPDGTDIVVEAPIPDQFKRLFTL